MINFNSYQQIYEIVIEKAVLAGELNITPEEFYANRRKYTEVEWKEFDLNVDPIIKRKKTMTNKDLEEIEQWIGWHKPAEFTMDDGDGIYYKTINPNEHIQRLVNEVKRLLAERDSDRKHTYRLATRIRQLNVEIDGGIDDDDVPHQGWKDFADVLKKRVGELEKELAKCEIDKLDARGKIYDLMHEGIKNELIFQTGNPEMMEELEIAQTARATAEAERDDIKNKLGEEMAKCHKFTQNPKRAKCDEFYMHAGYSVIEKIIDYAKKLERMVKKACKDGRYLDSGHSGWIVLYNPITREWLKGK